MTQLLSSESEPAPRFRRMLAWITDIFVTVAIAQLVGGAIGYFNPPETSNAFIASLVPGLALGFVYMGFAVPLLGNSLGKWLFGLRIVAYRGERLSFMRWVARVLLVGLWPINAVMVLASKPRRHLADMAASTMVTTAQPMRSFWLGFAGAVVSVAVALNAGALGMKVCIVNSAAWRAAKEEAVKQAPGKAIAALPAGFQIVNDDAAFEADVEHEFRRVILKRSQGRWLVQSSELVGEPSLGTRISFGSTHAENL